MQTEAVDLVVPGTVYIDLQCHKGRYIYTFQTTYNHNIEFIHTYIYIYIYNNYSYKE